MANGRIESDPLFLGLARPAVAFGVPYGWFLIEALALVVYFVNSSDFIGFVLCGIFVHGIGYFITSKEPRLVDIFIIKTSKCMKCKNTRFHGGTQSFDLY